MRLPRSSHAGIGDPLGEQAPLLGPPVQQRPQQLEPRRPPERPERTNALLEAAAAATLTAAALSGDSREVSRSFEQVAVAVAELHASIGDIADSAGCASSVASQAVQHATAVTERVTTLQQASGAIGGIVQLISSITAQSRMLALNATIEAARAGDAGLGFAVVAREVKQLADKTAQAAEHVAEQIAAVQRETQAAVADIGQVAATIGQISAAQGSIAAAVQQQSAAAGRISEHVDVAAAGSGRISALVAELAQAQQATFVRTALATARQLLEDRGGFQLGDTPVTWAARNEVTQQTVQVQLPQVLIDGQWLGQNDNPHRPTRFVDEVTALVGGSTTLFQRLNSRGDMLRVATDVLTNQSRRNIGTYIPVAGPQGPTPVLAQVLAGQSYIGEATIAGRAYFTAYDPITSSAGEVIGLLYVGLPI